VKERETLAELPLFSLDQIVDVSPNVPPCGMIMFDVIHDDENEPQLVIACGPDRPMFVASLSMAGTRALALALLEVSSEEMN
jgi:hypothetical protein